MSTSAWTRVSAHLRIPCVEHSGPGRNGVPWARAAYGGASRQGPHRTAAPLSPSGWIPSCTFSGWQCPTGPAHVAASPTTPPIKWLPATPLVAPTENIRVFSRWSPRAILLAPIRANIQPWFKRAFVANQDAPQDDSPPINRVGPRSRCCVNEVCTPSSCLRGDAREVLSLRQCGAETHHPAR